MSVSCLQTVKLLNSSIWLIDGTLTGTTILGQSGPGTNDNKGVLHIPQSSITGTLLSDSLVSYSGHVVVGGGGLLPLCRDAVSVFWSPSG